MPTSGAASKHCTENSVASTRYCAVIFCYARRLGLSRALHRRPDNLARAIPSYLTEVCLGELRQNQNNHNFKLSEREYFKIIRGKTAALFEACFYAGFILSDAPESAKDAYTQIGDDLGIIFQLSDDCADYAASRKVTKKPVLSDYSRGVITLPLIHAMKKDNELLRRAQEGMKPADLKIAVEAAGGLTYTRRKIDKLYRRADALLGTMALSAFQKELLTTLLRRTSPEFNRAFYGADVVIAKGMGNYEGLYGCDRGDIWFLMIAKCNVIARLTGTPRGSILCMRKV